MAWYAYTYKALFDPNTQQLAPAGSEGQVYAVSDTGFTNPIPAYDLSGMPVQLAANDIGFIPDFQVEDHVELLWKSGDYVFHLTTTTPLTGPVGTSVAGAQVSGDALTFTLDNGAMLPPVTLPTGPGGSDAGVAGYVEANGSATDAALNAKFERKAMLNVKAGPYNAGGTPAHGSDGAKIQAAINDAHANYIAGSGPTTVYLPTGTYNLAATAETDIVTRLVNIEGGETGAFLSETVRSCLVLRAGVSLVGDGIGRTTLSRAASGPNIVLELLDYKDGTIEGMTVRGPGVDSTTHGVFFSVSGQSGHMNKNVTIRGVEVSHMGYYGIGHQYGSPENVHYEDIWVHDVGDDGIDHKVRMGTIDYLNNGTNGVFFENILVERWGTKLSEASALDIRGQATLNNITCRDFGTTGNRLYGITLQSGTAGGNDKRAAATRSTLTNFYVEGKPGFDCIGVNVNSSGQSQISNGLVRWCTTNGVWARNTLGAPTQSWVNGPAFVGVTVEGSRAGNSFLLDTRSSVIGGRVVADYQHFDATRGNLAAGRTTLALWHAPGTARSLVKNGATLVEGADYTVSGATVTLTVAAIASDVFYMVSNSTVGVNVNTVDCTVVGLDSDNFSTGVLAGATALVRTVQAGNRAGATAQLAMNVSGGIPRLQVVNAGSANIDLALMPAGSGLVKYGTFTTNADAAVTGYVSIKDAAGTVRKLAVIA